IRELWDTSERGGARAGGEFYSVAGAKRGPAPAHDMPIWVGGYRPRMLRLIGRTADGWVPSLGYMKPGDVARGSATIDAAAREAGRDPAAIRRVLNIGGRFESTSGGMLQGPPEKWVDDLLPLVVDDGVGTLILASDDPSTLEPFIDSVAPALRAAAPTPPS